MLPKALTTLGETVDFHHSVLQVMTQNIRFLCTCLNYGDQKYIYLQLT